MEKRWTRRGKEEREVAHGEDDAMARAEWSGVEQCSGVKWSGVELSAVE